MGFHGIFAVALSNPRKASAMQQNRWRHPKRRAPPPSLCPVLPHAGPLLRRSVAAPIRPIRAEPSKPAAPGSGTAETEMLVNPK